MKISVFYNFRKGFFPALAKVNHYSPGIEKKLLIYLQLKTLFFCLLSKTSHTNGRR